jgi:hypothetical protein
VAVLQGIPSPFRSYISVPFHQVFLKDVADYLALLYDRKLSWSFVGVLRSAIHISISPIDGVSVGEHPITRLTDGVFDERPRRQKVPTLWDPL